jgi:UDP-N-acetylglucosamine 2-epimerase (non-hydrolysing)/GDP/UDP-N,N'-diacetylbacillosamine 2-epimerase (hydrolysing)
MTTRRRICVVTGSRAEYGILYWLLREIAADATLELQLVATAMHLSPEFGLTYRQIEQDGFKINAKVEMLLSSDTAVGIAKSIGIGVVGFADALDRLKPDLLVLAGDRFEMLAAAQVALVSGIPIAHLSGGDTTEGAYDESIRHSLTKMAQLHFVTNELSGRRVRQMGENPARIFNVGTPQLEHLSRTPLLSREELEKALGFHFRKRNLLVTFHPATLERQSPAEQFSELLAALRLLDREIGIIFTLPNADNDGRALIKMIGEFVENAGGERATAHASLGHLRYLSVLANVDALVGNSSSALTEAPSFRKPAVNIGDRQKGRLRAASVIDCPPQRDDIRAAVEKALELDCAGIANPYGGGDSASRMATVLRTVALDDLRQKHFFLQEGK